METKCLQRGCQHPARRRGLCEAHYQQFARKKRSLDADRQEAFDQFAVSRGAILPRRQGKREANPFDRLAEEFGNE